MTTFAAIDFETAHTEPDSACALAVVRVEEETLVAVRYHLLKPPPRDEFMFTDIHGITPEDVRGAPTFEEAWPFFVHLLEDVDFIAAHNAPFDKRVLKACLKVCETRLWESPSAPWLCTVQMARDVFGIYPTKLSDVCRELEITLDHHQAVSDAKACARIVSTAVDKGATMKRYYGGTL